MAANQINLTVNSLSSLSKLNLASAVFLNYSFR